ncbi:monosaccharide ABC transporter substrate-binding protein (CUT2 family) [Paraburkholderia sp. BL27I4N3]|uniref:sugar ABC transporter substrate-binding protein n=1 Tax=Paraburkholderia sp. BL27I4N3 TaxID=1938805 RepID=UPI000E3869BD|nr:sugar ABC transporter substrate-binding protein [Paraburkholderia sp. BL27I4N3]REE07106.1 monosaccharide ABC transporter substrate-binding protein (CUT2 family) [Paraburkholderia sp. BL27I4N3]
MFSFKSMISGVALAASAILGLSGAAFAKDQVYLSMSYIGNDWQAEAANMARAMALHPSMKDKINFDVQVAGPNAQKQIQQIHAMVQAGAKAIIVYPISPTALNQVVKEACDKGVAVFAYDAEITEPCAHNVHIDQYAAGKEAAEWLVKKMGGKGNVVYISGVPGTSTDSTRTKASMDVFAKYPGIKVIAQGVGMWSQAVARTEMSKILATHPWDQIDGLLVQAGCYTIFSMQDEAGIPDAKKKFCSGEGSNGHRIQMLKADAGVTGASGTYRPMAAQSFSYASPPVSAALALKLAVQVMHGEKMPHDIIVPLPQVTNENVKLCKEGTWAEMKAGCNVFQPSVISNPGWFAEIFNPNTPEVGLAAALHGQPEK